MERLLDCKDCGNEFTAQRSDAMRCQPCRAANRSKRQMDYERKHLGVCSDCGASIVRRSGLCRPCMLVRRGEAQRGENNPSWKGGRTMHAGGYIQILVGGAKRYKFEHHIVWEAANGPLPRGWVVHHLNGVKTDNRLENLAGMPRHEHHKHPREALVPYEERIKILEDMLASVATERSQ